MKDKKKIMILLLTALVLILSCWIPQQPFLGTAGIRTIGIVIAFLILLVSEALPITLICLIFIGLMPVLHVVASFNAALSGFSNQVVFFILASFGIAAAFTRVPLTTRVLAFLIRRFGKSIQSILLAIMVCSALLSSVVSNVPTCAIFMALGLKFLEFYDDENQRKASGKAFMIAIPISSMIGGMITPAGSSINLLAISLLEQYTGSTITFVQWMGFGIPLTLLMIPFAWLCILLVFKPAEITGEQIDRFLIRLDIEIPPKMGSDERKVLAVVGIMLVLWIASSWIPGINVMVVALLGCCVMFLPGMDILDMKRFLQKNVSWDSFFLVGTVLSIGNALVENGVSQWIQTLLPTASLSLPVLLAFESVLIFALLIVIPVAPSLVTLLAAPLIALGGMNGCAPELVVLVLGLVAANCYLLPLDTVTLLTYGTGYYAMSDMPKCTLWLQLFMTALMATLVPLLGRILGIV